MIFDKCIFVRRIDWLTGLSDTNNLVLEYEQKPAYLRISLIIF